jgi:hypothetical protein
MLATLRTVLTTTAILLALPLFFAGFLVAPLLVLAGGLVIFALSAPG